MTNDMCLISLNKEPMQNIGFPDGLPSIIEVPRWAVEFYEVVFGYLNSGKCHDWTVDYMRTCKNVTDWEAKYHEIMVCILEVAEPYDASRGRVVHRAIDLHKLGSAATTKQWDTLRAVAGEYSIIFTNDLGYDPQAYWDATGCPDNRTAWRSAWASRAASRTDAATAALDAWWVVYDVNKWSAIASGFTGGNYKT